MRLDAHLATTYGYHMDTSTKTTVYLDSADYRRLKALASAQGRTAAELVREAVALYARAHAAPPRPGSIGAGSSGRGDLSERVEDLLKGMGEHE
jgi:hypothetical protein